MTSYAIWLQKPNDTTRHAARLAYGLRSQADKAGFAGVTFCLFEHIEIGPIRAVYEAVRRMHPEAVQAPNVRDLGTLWEISETGQVWDRDDVERWTLRGLRAQRLPRIRPRLMHPTAAQDEFGCITRLWTAPLIHTPHWAVWRTPGRRFHWGRYWQVPEDAEVLSGAHTWQNAFSLWAAHARQYGWEALEPSEAAPTVYVWAPTGEGFPTLQEAAHRLGKDVSTLSRSTDMRCLKREQGWIKTRARTKTRIICEETGEVFKSVAAAARDAGLSRAAMAAFLDRPDEISPSGRRYRPAAKRLTGVRSLTTSQSWPSVAACARSLGTTPAAVSRHLRSLNARPISGHQLDREDPDQ